MGDQTTGFFCAGNGGSSSYSCKGRRIELLNMDICLAGVKIGKIGGFSIWRDSEGGSAMVR
jgi:hypothetical protein